MASAAASVLPRELASTASTTVPRPGARQIGFGTRPPELGPGASKCDTEASSEALR